MTKNGRYDVSGLGDAQFEAGSNEQVLKNRLGIRSPKEMHDAEIRALERAMIRLVGKYTERHRFAASDIREIHKSWLGAIYEWAGAAQVPGLMAQLERDVLRRNTICAAVFPIRIAVFAFLAAGLCSQIH